MNTSAPAIKTRSLVAGGELVLLANLMVQSP